MSDWGMAGYGQTISGSNKWRLAADRSFLEREVGESSVILNRLSLLIDGGHESILRGRKVNGFKGDACGMKEVLWRGVESGFCYFCAKFFEVTQASLQCRCDLPPRRLILFCEIFGLVVSEIKIICDKSCLEEGYLRVSFQKGDYAADCQSCD